MIAQGVPYSRIVTDLDLENDKNRVTSRSLRNHFDKGHMPVQAESVRRVLESRAIARGMSLEDDIQRAVDAQGFAEMVLQSTVQRLAAGELHPEIAHGMDAAKLLALVSPHEQASNEQDYVRAFMIYHSVAQEIMTPSQFADFGVRLSRDPLLAALLAKYNEDQPAEDEDFYAVPALESGDIEDAEIVEDDETDETEGSTST